MNPAEIASNLLAYSLQIALVLGLALPLPRLLRLRRPAMRLAYYYALLAAVLLLPVFGYFAASSQAVSTASILSMEIIVTNSAPAAADSHFIPAILAVVAGVGLFRLSLLSVGILQLRRLRDSGSPLRPHDLSEKLRLRCKCAATIVVSDRVKAPVAFGWRGPVIVVPRAFEELEEPAREAVLCHELLHLRRRDWIFVLFEQAVMRILWFHPAIHILLDRISLVREQLVDREVVRITGRVRVYLETLKHAAEAFRQTSAAPAISFIRASHLKERVVLLKQEVCMSRSRQVALGIVLAFCLVALSAGVLAAFPASWGSLAQVRAQAALGNEVAVAAEPTVQQEKKQEGEEKEGNIEVSDDVNVKTRLVKRVNPVYPQEAKEQGITGAVKCRVRIEEDGKVGDVNVLESPHELLSQSAVDAIRQWEYEPPMRDGKAVAALCDVTINYKLK